MLPQVSGRSGSAHRLTMLTRWMPLSAAALLCGSLLAIRARWLSGKKMCRRGSVGSSSKRAVIAQCLFQQRLEALGEAGERLAFVGVRHLQIQRAELFGRGGQGGKQRRQAVALGQIVHFRMQRQQLAGKGQLPVGQFRLALQHDESRCSRRFRWVWPGSLPRSRARSRGGSRSASWVKYLSDSSWRGMVGVVINAGKLNGRIRAYFLLAV